ncbi:G1/S-specific cyclin-E1 isoform X2 [Protopterus annectens]|uniref:G1/S-specific cyclin-E1 isoform X2 n=1 Tax=Protopterus annectens TaxID=7888 RepID=UPI001CFB6992|nr:G1/S-specific cyclin-E1 isoform X2 [Protopterus annectens]
MCLELKTIEEPLLTAVRMLKNGDGTNARSRTNLVEGTVGARKRKADVANYLQDPDEEIVELQLTKKRHSETWRTTWKSTSPYRSIPTPDAESDSSQSSADVTLQSTADVTLCTFFTPTRSSPLYILGWANQEDVWNNMLSKEQNYPRDKYFMQKHPLLQPKMRAILLDWLMEVSEVYRLNRETFYLAQDFFDRFMATQKNVVKTRLQLIGISSLFVAAKLEEIYPPKVQQFAYVTDGACTEGEIFQMELILMKALNWSLSPVTAVTWLKIFMQVAYLKELYEVLLPQYPPLVFVQVMELLDLCILDIDCLEFTYGVLAASALFHFSSFELVHKVSGYEWSDIEFCVKWMVTFALAVREAGHLELKSLKGVAPEDLHNIQTHSKQLILLDLTKEKQATLLEQNRTSPVPSGVLTPPQSSKKQSSTFHAV